MVIDPIVHVDRSTPLVFPDWVKQVTHPELQDVGPDEFDVTKLERWPHDDHKTGFVNGKITYTYHKEHDMLKGDLGLHELLAIQARGIKFFRAHFKGEYPVGQKSVVLDHGDYLHGPALCELDGKVILYWRWVGYDFDAGNPARCFASDSPESPLGPQELESQASSNPQT